jgi:hypothetical protein
MAQTTRNRNFGNDSQSSMGQQDRGMNDNGSRGMRSQRPTSGDTGQEQGKMGTGMNSVYMIPVKRVRLPRKESKKEQILGLYLAGSRSVGELAALTQTRPSYVASVLRAARALHGYFDLYTTTEQQMNIYSALFAKRLGFRTEGIARRSARYIDRLYSHFERIGDRAGQHHCLVMALTMFDRARWSGKIAEAEFFRQWLVSQLESVRSIPMSPATSLSIGEVRAGMSARNSPRYTPKQERQAAHIEKI